MPSHTWQATITLNQIRLSEKEEVLALLEKFTTWAGVQNWNATVSEVKPTERTNCPNCGRLVRNARAKTCGMCGYNFSTGKVR